MQISAMIGLPTGSLAPLLAVVWVALLVLVSVTTQRSVRVRCLGPALGTGVPILGWLTYNWGLMPGLSALAIGALVLGALLRQGGAGRAGKGDTRRVI